MVKIERTGKYMLTVQENNGEKFYCLYDILRQTDRTTEALSKNQTPIKLDCRIIYGYRFTGEDFLTSVFVDEDGLKQLAGD